MAYEYYTVSSMTDSQISLDGDKKIHRPLLPAIFPEAKELVVLLCTIGPRLKSAPAAASGKPATTK